MNTLIGQKIVKIAIHKKIFNFQCVTRCFENQTVFFMMIFGKLSSLICFYATSDVQFVVSYSGDSRYGSHCPYRLGNMV